MPKINILEPSVFNKIAAGEVVERPSSIVKELVENSIDAGATRISVSINMGGISKISIIDNGCGIEKDDLKIAYLPHTTSKIKIAEDLDNISTLGFRGEALASICAVSKVCITTKTANSTAANYIKINGGEVVEQGETGGKDGTAIVVEDLFYNVPVRAKFLKKPHQEEGEIRTLLTRLILANPNIAIKYDVDGQTVFNSQGTGLYDALFAIYGKNTITNIIPVDYKRDGYSLTGYISKTNFFKPNRTYQTLIINNRYVTDYLVSQAVSRAFEPYMLKQCFPLYVLNLTIPTGELDVNVHPSKMEVRFANSQQIFGFVYNGIKDAIDSFLLDRMSSFNTTGNTETQTEIEQEKPEEQQNNINIPTTTLENGIKNEINPEFKGADVLHDNQGFPQGEILIEKLNKASFFTKEPEQEPLQELKSFTPKPIQEQILSNEIIEDDVALSLKIVGKIFNTFVIVEYNNIIYLIDQHAAHERILYDKLVENIKANTIKKQGMFIPYTFEVNSQEYEFLNKNLPVLNDLGFEIEPFGNRSFKVSTCPADLVDLQIGNFFNEILKDLNTYLTLKTEDVLKDTLAQHACKHAVKGGDDLNKEEMIALIKRISSGQMTMQCPHGRPFVVEITRAQVDKWFKRTL